MLNHIVNSFLHVRQVLRLLGPALIDPHYSQKASVALQRNSSTVWSIASEIVLGEDGGGDEVDEEDRSLVFVNKHRRPKLQLRQTGDIRVSGNRFVLAGSEFSSMELVSAALSDSGGGGQRLSFATHAAGTVWDLRSDAPDVAGFGEHDKPSAETGTLQLFNAGGFPVLRIGQSGETVFGRSNLRVGSAAGQLLFTVDASTARHGITYSRGGDAAAPGSPAATGGAAAATGGAPSQVWRVQLNDAAAPAGHEDHWSLHDAKDEVRVMVAQSSFEDAGNSLVDDDSSPDTAFRNVGIVLDASTIVGDLPADGPTAPSESLASFTPRDLLVTGDLVVGAGDPAETQSGNLRVRGEVSAGASVSTRGSLLIRNATSGDPAVTFQADDEGGLNFIVNGDDQATRATTVFRANGDVEVPGQVTATGLKVKPKIREGAASEAFLRLENSLEDDRTVFELANTATGRLTIRSREFVNGVPHGLPVPHLPVSQREQRACLVIPGRHMCCERLKILRPQRLERRASFVHQRRRCLVNVVVFVFGRMVTGSGDIGLGLAGLPGFVLRGSAGVAPRARVDVVGSRPRLWRMDKARKDAVQLARDGGYDYDPTLEPWRDGFSTGDIIRPVKNGPQSP